MSNSDTHKLGQYRLQICYYTRICLYLTYIYIINTSIGRGGAGTRESGHVVILNHNQADRERQLNTWKIPPQIIKLGIPCREQPQLNPSLS